ncbi:hypothetical protein TEA_023367 [Camellia sinensis var. sinensis]|uniref:F-box domain-containing protein n=1 Tax=Camellia sinensis var. sinensis TaxID=542762 RepID=A0A4S4E6Q7_CAMSN|nr:hypothetical protein TEA_023367 [Camellia sinensis var. sinensis]
MGAGFSGFVAEKEAPLSPSLGDIPESCVALVLNYLDAPEICNLGRVNRVFRQASSTDFVWESKLPENYQSLVKKLFNQNPDNLPKRHIYSILCRPIRFDAGTKEVWMEKRSGEICVSISWKGLKITGIDDRRYWNHIPTDESRREFGSNSEKNKKEEEEEEEEEKEEEEGAEEVDWRGQQNGVDAAAEAAAGGGRGGGEAAMQRSADKRRVADELRRRRR